MTGQSLGRIAGDFFASILLFHSAPDSQRPSSDVLRGQVSSGLDAFAKHPATHDVPPEEVEEARFALVAWADEMIIKSDWRDREQWNHDPLQLQMYRTNRAGNEFFDHLNALRSDQSAAREVYYLCLALGFEGQYAGHPAERQTCMQQQFEMLRAAGRAADVATTRPLAPPAYEVAIQLQPGGRRGPLALVFGWTLAALGLFGLFWVALYFTARSVPLPPGS